MKRKFQYRPGRGYFRWWDVAMGTMENPQRPVRWYIGPYPTLEAANEAIERGNYPTDEAWENRHKSSN